MELSIRHIEHSVADGLVLTVHWKATEGSKSLEGSTHLAKPEGVMIPYVEVTEDIAMGWLTSNLDIEGITAKLQEATPPAKGSGLPWVVTMNNYSTAVARLARYILADGQAESTTMVDTLEVAVDADGMQVLDADGNVTYVQEAVITPFIEALEATVEVTTYSDDMDAEPTVETIENPLITQDNLERVDAQAVIDITPAEVVTAYEA